MNPTRQQLVSILALMQNAADIGGNAYFITKKQLLDTCLPEGDLLVLPACVYDGAENDRYIFLKDGLEKHLGISKIRAENLERTKTEMTR